MPNIPSSALTTLPLSISNTISEAELWRCHHIAFPVRGRHSCSSFHSWAYLRHLRVFNFVRRQSHSIQSWFLTSKRIPRPRKGNENPGNTSWKSSRKDIRLFYPEKDRGKSEARLKSRFPFVKASIVGNWLLVSKMEYRTTYPGKDRSCLNLIKDTNL